MISREAAEAERDLAIARAVREHYVALIKRVYGSLVAPVGDEFLRGLFAEVDASLGGKEGAPRSGGGAAAHGGECSKPEPPSDLRIEELADDDQITVPVGTWTEIVAKVRRKEKQRAAGIIRHLIFRNHPHSDGCSSCDGAHAYMLDAEAQQREEK